MRLIVIASVISICFFACIKEGSVETGDPFSPDPPVDSVENEIDSCRLIKFIQGTDVGDDSVFTLFFDANDHLVKMVNYSQSANESDSILFFYNGAGQLTRMFYDCPAPMEITYTYAAGKLSKMKITEPARPGDSTIYTYEYGTGTKPTRRNYYSYDAFTGTGGLAGFKTYKYDGSGNITELVNRELNTNWDSARFVYQPLSLNSFRLMRAVSEALNLIDLRNGAIVELGWNESQLLSGKFYKPGGAIDYELNMFFETDSLDNVSKIRSVRKYNGLPDEQVYTYRLSYECK